MLLLVLKTVVHTCVNWPLFRIIDLGCLHEYNTSIPISTSDDAWEHFPIPSEIDLYVTDHNGIGNRRRNESGLLAVWDPLFQGENFITSEAHYRGGFRSAVVFSASHSSDGESFVHDVSAHISATRDLFANPYIACRFYFKVVNSKHPKGVYVALDSSPTYLKCR